MATSTVYKLQYIKVAGERFRALTSDRVESVLKAVTRRPTWEGLIVSPKAKLGLDGEGQYPRLHVAWYPEYGYEFHCLELALTSHFLATSSNLSKSSVYVELNGQGQELWPPELFVPFTMAAKAMRYLIRTGKRDPALHWVAIDKFPRRRTRPRGRT